MKKLASLILALSLCLALDVPAFAAEKTIYDGDYFEVNNVIENIPVDNLGGNYTVQLRAVAPVTVKITSSTSKSGEPVTYLDIDWWEEGDWGIDDFPGKKNVIRGDNNILCPDSYCVLEKAGNYNVTVGGVSPSSSETDTVWDIGLLIEVIDGQGNTETAPLPAQESVKIVPTSQRLTVDGVVKSTEIYNIDGSNYFKLRDMAALLSGTGSQFSVDYDAARNTIVIQTEFMTESQTSTAYKPVGGELTKGEDKSMSAVKSTQSLEIDGQKVNLTAYNIGGNNFFKLRELGAVLYFFVDYDADTATMIVRGLPSDERLKQMTNEEVEQATRDLDAIMDANFQIADKIK